MAVSATSQVKIEICKVFYFAKKHVFGSLASIWTLNYDGVQAFAVLTHTLTKDLLAGMSVSGSLSCQSLNTGRG